MIVKNRAKTTEIKNVKVANSIISKIKGLIFKKKGRLLLKFWFQDYHKIWMLFMKFPIDLVFIDKNKKIVDIIENIKPITFDIKTWKIYSPKKKCKYILEVESGLVKSKKFSIGDQLAF
ncbi:MAG: DUF192 domain-containing protein [Candidatus Aenigmarchaeota archaeon]|nr:DUF192 domain-containing protein [Candidatus Aenigmarchaeota archaeon]